MQKSCNTTKLVILRRFRIVSSIGSKTHLEYIETNIWKATPSYEGLTPYSTSLSPLLEAKYSNSDP